MQCARAQRGASMPLALLLFLICAMTASIVLMAGTTTAGRASNLAESDQAYYSVTSAANLFRDELLGPTGQGHAVTVAVQSDSSGSSASYQLLVSTDGTPASGGYSLLERAAVYLLFGKNVQDNEAAQTAVASYFSQTGSWPEWPNVGAVTAGTVGTFTLAHDSDSLDGQEQALELEVEANLLADGGLVFTFLKPGASAQDDYLAIFNLTCDADIESGIFEMADSSAGSEIKYATVTWFPSVVEKG